MQRETAGYPVSERGGAAGTADRGAIPDSPPPRARIAMMVSNPCSPDFRVNKQAESLARAGYEVRVFCTWKPGLGIPVHEVINGVTYVRREWNPMKLLRMRYLGEREYSQIPVMSRGSHFEIAEKYRPQHGGNAAGPTQVREHGGRDT